MESNPSPAGGRFWDGLRTVLAALLPFAVIIGAFYLCFLFYDQSQQEELRRDYLSTHSFRLLPKQIAAELNSAHVAILEGEPFESQLPRAGKISAQLDDLFNILDKGGVPAVLAASSQKMWINPVQSPEARAALRQAQDLYAPMRSLLEMLLRQEKPDPKQVSAAAELFDTRSSRFLSLSDIVRLHALEEATAAIHTQEIYLAATVLSALGLLLLMGFGFYYVLERRRHDLLTRSNRQISAAALEIAQAKQETDLILSTVSQGMLLMSSDATIGDQHSSALTEIFQTEHLAGFNFLHLLQRILSEKTFLITRDYFALLFDPAKKEKLLAKINPLARVEANFSQAGGGFAARHLEFAFRRILSADGATIERVFVAVRDITRQVELEESLKQSEQKKERQFELLLGILHIGPDALKEFIAMVEGELKQINEALKAEDLGAASGARQTAALRERLDLVFRAVHNIKGNAEFLKLEHFSKAAHAFEDSISELKGRARLAGDDFLGVAIHQAELRNDLAEVRDLADKLVGLRQGLAPAAATTARTRSGGAAAAAGKAAATEGLFDGMRSLASTLAARLGKEVDVQASDLNGSTPPAAYRGLMRDILIQLTRNSLVHGIEPSAERVAQGKARRATLSVGPASHPESGYPFGFVFRDDGRGLDPGRIRRLAVERGLVSERTAAAMGDAEAATLIFEPGFSTAEEVTADAGRGVGLDLVKARLIDELGGEVFIESEPGQFCEFTFLLPASTMNAASHPFEPALAGV